MFDPLIAEPLENANRERSGCLACGLFKACRSPFIRPYIPERWTGKLLLVGEAPGENEDKNGRPFDPGGKAGALLQRLWRKAGYGDVDVALVNAVICRPLKNRTPSMREVRACRSLLLGVIHALKPRYIVGLGTVATKALLNDGDAAVTALRGRRLIVPGLLKFSETCGTVPTHRVAGTTKIVSPEIPPSDSAHDSENRYLAIRSTLVVSEGVGTAAKSANAPSGERSTEHENVSGTDRTESSTDVHEALAAYDPIVYATFHPAATFYNRGKAAKAINPQIIADDLRRVADPETQPPDFALPVDKPRLLCVDTEWATDGTVTTASAATVTSCCAVEGYPDFFLLGPLLRDAEWIGGHSVAQDVEKLLEVKLPVKETWSQGRKVVDSLIVTRMVDENQPSYKLENLLASKENIGGWKAETNDILAEEGAEGLSSEARRKRCALDAWGAAKLLATYGPKLRERANLVEFTHRIAASLSRFSLAGAFVDLPYFNALGEELRAPMLEAQDRLTKAAIAAGMTEFVPTNDNHIRELLYERLGLEAIKQTPKGLDSVDKISLKNLDHPIAKLLLDYNSLEKLWSTNIEGVRENLVACGSVENVAVARLEFHFDPLGARTGRRSSSNPNSQNWSKRVRGIIRSRFIGGRIISHDYQKLEPRILAWIAKEPYLWRRFGPGGDGYIGVARDMWKREIQDGTREYTSTKSIILGVHYNMKTPYMAENLWNMGIRFSAEWDEHVRETDRLRTAYLNLIPNVVHYMHGQERALLRDGFVVAPHGMIRHLPLTEGKADKGFGHALNAAINFPVQSFASAVTGSAIIDTEEALLAEHGLSYRQWTEQLTDVKKKLTRGENCGIICKEIELPVLFNEVHDDVMTDDSSGNQDDEIVMECMRRVASLRSLVPSFTIPLDVDVMRGVRWGATA